MARTLSTSTAARWWEYYVLRYFVGTVIGALVMVFLAISSNSPLRQTASDLGVNVGVLTLTLQSSSSSPGDVEGKDNKLNATPPSRNDGNSIGFKDVPVLGALGFAYCYIASAPMLLLHATRSHIGLHPLRIRRRFWLITSFAIFSAYSLAVALSPIAWWSASAFGVLVFFAVVGVQVAAIVEAHADRFKTIKGFYYNLAQVRGRGDDVCGAQSTEEYVESYRHLREHGNAFAILALEVALAFALVSAGSPNRALIVVILWFLPSTYGWFIGSLLEAAEEWRQ